MRSFALLNTNHRKIFHQASDLLNTIAEDHQLPVIISAHPRSKSRLIEWE